MAHLHVLETWKGSSTPAVSVDFMEGLTCPAPDRYVEGETVLAFLASGESRVSQISDHAQRERFAKEWSGRWFTVGLSYGTLYFERDEVPLVRQLVADALGLQSRGTLADADRREWLVRAAAAPATRWHGLYGLSRDTDPMHSFYDHRAGATDLAAALTIGDREVLANAFARDPLLDHPVPMMLRVLAGHPDRAVDLASVAAMETALAEKLVPFWAREAMPLVLARFGEADSANEAAEAGTKCDFGDDPLFRSLERNDDEVRAAWARARARLRPARDRGWSGPPDG